MKVAAWIISVTLAVFAAFFLFKVLQSPFFRPVPVLVYVLAGCILAGAALLFPLFWRGETAEKFRWHRLVAALILAAIGVLTPIKTHAVRMDMPAASPPQ
jgi:xanthine/uracil permease